MSVRVFLKLHLPSKKVRDRQDVDILGDIFVHDTNNIHLNCVENYYIFTLILKQINTVQYITKQFTFVKYLFIYSK